MRPEPENKSSPVSMRMAPTLWAVGCLLLAASLAGQVPSDDEIRIVRRPYVPRTASALRVQAELVEVRVVVRDRERKPVAGLRQEDFQVFDSGKSQVISAFLVDQRPGQPSPQASTQPGASAASPPAPHSEAEPALPAEAPARYIAFFFDDWNMPLGDLGPARTATEKFVREGMRPGDRVGVFTTSSSVTLNFTSDPEKLHAALARVLPQQRETDRGEDFCPRISLFQAYLIAAARDRSALELGVADGQADGCLLGMPRAQAEIIVQSKADRTWAQAELMAQQTFASFESVTQRMAGLKGNRILLWASSGFFSLTPPVLRRQEAVVEAALRSGVVINSLDAKGVVAEWQGGAPSNPQPRRVRTQSNLANVARSIENRERDAVNDPLSAVAHGTGGRFFTNNNDLVTGVRELAVAPEISYLLGFTPKDLKADGRFHKLEVKLSGQAAEGSTVVARRGYYAPTATEMEQTGRTDKFEAAVSSMDTVAELACEVSATSERAADAAGAREAILRIVIRVDAGGLPFQRRGDRSVEKLRVVTALFDAQDNFVVGSEARVDLALRKETLERMREEGLEGEMELRVPRGTYRLRQVVQETVRGRMAAMSRLVEVQP